MLKFFLTNNEKGLSASVGLLLLRVAVCSVMLTHGMPKLLNFSTLSQTFDPLGIGGGLSLGLVVLAEAGCSISILFGFLTKLAVIPLIVAMCVAVFVVHGGDAFAAKELGLLYLSVFSALFFLGAGRYSVDWVLFK